MSLVKYYLPVLTLTILSLFAPATVGASERHEIMEGLEPRPQHDATALDALLDHREGFFASVGDDTPALTVLTGISGPYGVRTIGAIAKESGMERVTFDLATTPSDEILAAFNNGDLAVIFLENAQLLASQQLVLQPTGPAATPAPGAGAEAGHQAVTQIQIDRGPLGEELFGHILGKDLSKVVSGPPQITGLGNKWLVLVMDSAAEDGLPLEGLDANGLHQLRGRIPREDYLRRDILPRFVPEEAARLGEAFVFVPSLNKRSWLDYIRNLLLALVSPEGTDFDLGEDVVQEIYMEGVKSHLGFEPVNELVSRFARVLMEASVPLADHPTPPGKQRGLQLRIADGGGAMEFNLTFDGDPERTERVDLPEGMGGKLTTPELPHREFVAEYLAARTVVFSVLFSRFPEFVSVRGRGDQHGGVMRVPEPAIFAFGGVPIYGEGMPVREIDIRRWIQVLLAPRVAQSMMEGSGRTLFSPEMAGNFEASQLALLSVQLGLRDGPSFPPGSEMAQAIPDPFLVGDMNAVFGGELVRAQEILRQNESAFRWLRNYLLNNDSIDAEELASRAEEELHEEGGPAITFASLLRGRDGDPLEMVSDCHAALAPESYPYFGTRRMGFGR